MSEKEYFVHPSSVVDEGAQIGKGTKVWHFCHVMAKAKIGERCVLGQNVYVGSRVALGNNVKVQNNVSIYDEVYLEDDVFCGPSMVFTNVINPRSHVIRKDEYKKTVVKRGASLGANCTIVCGNTVGEYAFVGAGAVVTQEVPPYALVLGVPARLAGWMCACGIRLNFTGKTATCQSCGKSYTKVHEREIVEVASASSQITQVQQLDLKAQYKEIREEVQQVVNRVLESQHFILGPEVEALEKEIAAYCGCQYAIGVSSGTDALLVALMALEIKAGDEVITSPYTFFATAGVISRVGAKPVFVDITPATYNIDPAQLEKAITPRTRAIMPVHLFGQCAEMDSLLDIARRHRLAVIEDAAQAIGSEYKGKRAGAMGAIGCFSFFPSKNLGACGDGGMVTTNDEALASKLKILRVHGANPKYYHSLVGGNFRLDALQAAILRVKLKHLDRWSAKRQEVAADYSRRLQSAGLAGKEIGLPALVQSRHIFNQYVVRASNRDALLTHLERCKVGTAIYYPVPLHRQACFASLGYAEGSFPHSEQAARETLALPIYAELTEAERAYVVECIAGFYGKK